MEKDKIALEILQKIAGMETDDIDKLAKKIIFGDPLEPNKQFEQAYSIWKPFYFNGSAKGETK